MARRGTRWGLLVACAALVMPAAALADTGAATISACKDDHLTVSGRVRATGADARKARGAKLQMRLQAMPLFGLPRAGKWRDLGKKRSASAQEAFSGLPADNWIGVLDWRFKKGSRTVLSGLARSEPARGGRANCVLAVGAKPVDATPPDLLINPADDSWHHAPAPVQLIAQDAYTGVKSMSYSLDGGALTPIKNGSGFTIPGEGAHTVDWQATDVAGNTATRSATVRVDAAPPTKPAITSPGAVTSSANPTFSWTASTDSGSGLRTYVLTIRRGDGSVVTVQPVAPPATNVALATTLNDGEAYTATVTAVDNTVDPAWATDSDPLTFRVDKNADVASFAPPSGAILGGAAKSGTFTLNLDRAADPATVSKQTVLLNLDGDTDPNYTAACANTPCTAITVDPTGTLPEGHYTLSVSGVKSAGEGLTFSGTAKYAVPYVESGSIQASVTTLACGVNQSSTTTTPSAFTVSGGDPGLTAFLDFDMATTGPWTVEAKSGATSLGSLDGTGGGHYRLNFPFGGNSAGSLTIQVTIHCNGSQGATATASNLFGARYP